MNATRPDRRLVTRSRAREGSALAGAEREVARPWRQAWRRVAFLVAAALVVVAVAGGVSGVAGIGERLSAGRPTWLILAGAFELLSIVGFLAVFELLFGTWLPRTRRLRIGLVVRAATILLPAGGLVAIGAGARAMRGKGMPAAKTGSRMLAFLLITNAPNVVVLGGLGVALGIGLFDGPHDLALTLVPGLIAIAVIAATWQIPRLSHQRVRDATHRFRHLSRAAAQLELGVIEAQALLRARDRKLVGTFAYYALDNAVLWATFKAFAHAQPPVATLVMAYLIGSSAGSIPLPAGIGAVEGGMIGLLVLYGAPAICAGVAVLAYRAVSTGLPLALGGVGLVALGRPLLRQRLATDGARAGLRGRRVST